MNNLQTQTSQQDPEPEKEQNFHNTNNNIDDFGMLDYDVDSSCSTPYVSAPSSPGRASSAGGGGGYYYSAPASPMHFLLSSSYSPLPTTSSTSSSGVHHEEFEFSARFAPIGSNQTGSGMSSADELFLNGKIRPMKLSTHLERPQVLAPLLDLENEELVEDGDEDNNKVIEKKFSIRGRDLRLRDKSLRRRTRSMSPLRSLDPPFGWNYGDDDDEEEHEEENGRGKKGISLVGVGGGGEIQEKGECKDLILECSEIETLGGVGSSSSAANSTATSSASSSRSSSAGRSSKRWVFLKDFLRSKSEGRSNNKFWSSISFSPSPKDKRSNNTNSTAANGNGASTAGTPASTGGLDGDKSNNGKKNIGYGHHLKKQGKPVNGAGKRRVPLSPHELHYTANRAQAEELRKKTFLPYKQGLLGCLGFSSKGYGAVNGFARALNPVSSR